MREIVKVSEERIRACASFTDVLRLCCDVSGRSRGEIAWNCGWKDGGRVLSRILRDGGGDDQRYMPHQMMVPFMLACGNAAPLWWLMMQLELKPEDAPHFEPGSDFLQQLAVEQLECRRLLTEVLTDVRSAKPANATEAHFCLVDRDVLPAWLVDEAMSISRRFGMLLALSAGY